MRSHHLLEVLQQKRSQQQQGQSGSAGNTATLICLRSGIGKLRRNRRSNQLRVATLWGRNNVPKHHIFVAIRSETTFSYQNCLDRLPNFFGGGFFGEKDNTRLFCLNFWIELGTD